MSNIESIASSLTMEHIVFDKVSFTRKGFKQKDDSEISLSFHVSISQTDNPDVTRVTLQVLADAQDEYDAEIMQSDTDIPDMKKEKTGMRADRGNSQCVERGR